MNDIYLTDATREYYTRALAHIRNCEDDFWDLDAELDNFIDTINLSPNVRTMYSKKGKNGFGYGLGSYLIVCYAKEVESKIKDGIDSKLKAVFANNKRCELLSQFRQPRIQEKNDKANAYLQYEADPNYWNISNVRFELKGGSADDHTRFWTLLTEELSGL